MDPPNETPNLNEEDEEDTRVFLSVLGQGRLLGAATLDLKRMQIRLGKWITSNDDSFSVLQSLKDQVSSDFFLFG